MKASIISQTTDVLHIDHTLIVPQQKAADQRGKAPKKANRTCQILAKLRISCKAPTNECIPYFSELSLSLHPYMLVRSRISGLDWNRWSPHRSHRSRALIASAKLPLLPVNSYTALLHLVCPSNSNLTMSTYTRFTLKTSEWVTLVVRITLAIPDERHHQVYEISIHMWTWPAVIRDMCFVAIFGSEYVSDLWWVPRKTICRYQITDALLHTFGLSPYVVYLRKCTFFSQYIFI